MSLDKNNLFISTEIAKKGFAVVSKNDITIYVRHTCNHVVLFKARKESDISVLLRSNLKQKCCSCLVKDFWVRTKKSSPKKRS